MKTLKKPAEGSTLGCGEPADQAVTRQPDTGAAEEVPVFDRSMLVEILGDEQCLIDQVLDRYLGFVGSYLDMLGSALFCPDLLQVQMLSNAIRGAAINIGALQVSEAAGRLEDLAKQGELDGGVVLYDRLLASVETFRAALEQEAKY